MANEAVRPLNILQRLHAVMKEVAYIQKDKDVGEGKYAYKAVTHDNVVAHTRKLFVDHGIHVSISLVPGTAKSVEVTRPKASGPDGKAVRFEGEFDVTFANIDDPTDKVVLREPAHGEDSGDKAPGKAASYAKKNGVLHALYLETGADDEGRTSEEAGPAMLKADDLRDYLAEIGKAADEPALQAWLKTARKSIVDVAGKYAGHPDWVKIMEAATKRKGDLAEAVSAVGAAG